MQQRARTPERIVFFDGVCGLCNRFVDHLLRIDRKHVLRFAPLQGTTAQELLPPGLADALESVVYLRDGEVIKDSGAGLLILIELGGWRKLHRGWFIFPRAVRDAVYRWLARHRYRWFGKRDACRVPSGEEVERFLP